MRQVFQYALGLSDQETTFIRRGFHAGNPRVRDRLEHVGRTFIKGYNQALETSDVETLARRLERTNADLRGFGFEGAATALALLDHLVPWHRGRLRRFINGPATGHIYMTHVGVGWAIARVPWLRRNIDKCLAQLDPLLGWLAIDGYGFQSGFFHAPNCIRAKTYPNGLSKYARRVFDQGLGRSLWFVEGADASRILLTIASFPKSRRADLWSGIGLASAYAGGADESAFECLREAGKGYVAHMAQGAAFAAKARERAGNQAEHTETACRILCGLSSEAAASITDQELETLPTDRDEPAYEIWRKRIQARFVTEDSG